MTSTRSQSRKGRQPSRACKVGAGFWAYDESSPVVPRDIIFGPLKGDRATGAVIWLHGLDDTPESWAMRLEPERRRHPRWKWVHLRAPERPITCYEKMRHPAWGDFLDSGAVRVGSRDYETRDPKGWYAESVARVHRAIEALAAEGVPPSRTALVGFSQGGALAAEAALTLGARLAGWGLLAGWLTPRARAALVRSAKTGGLAGSRVLISHSSGDEQVLFECATLAGQKLSKAGARVQFAQLAGVMHVAGEAQMRKSALTFLEEVLDGTRAPAAEAPADYLPAAPPACSMPQRAAAALPSAAAAGRRKGIAKPKNTKPCPACVGRHRAHTCEKRRR